MLFFCILYAKVDLFILLNAIINRNQQLTSFRLSVVDVIHTLPILTMSLDNRIQVPKFDEHE